VFTRNPYHRDIPYGQVGILLTFLGDLPLLVNGSESLSIVSCASYVGKRHRRCFILSRLTIRGR
jgi:hypothetical protein